MIIKTAILIISLILTALSGFCYSEEQLNNIEINRYGQTFEDESLSSRLVRLENDLFGMTQSGDIDGRLDMISQMVQNSKNPSYISYNEDYYPGIKQNPVKKVWNSISSGFSGGSLTGFTPSINSFGYSNNLYGNGMLDFLNGANNYCPYHNRYYRNHLFNNHHFPMGYRPNHRFIPHNNFSSLSVPNYTNFNAQYVNPYNYYQRRLPSDIYTNVSTRSNVHIIKD